MSDERLTAAEPVQRDDGRYYIPICTTHPRQGKSEVVMRVASDAFHTMREAEQFADEIVGIVNAHLANYGGWLLP